MLAACFICRIRTYDLRVARVAASTDRPAEAAADEVFVIELIEGMRAADTDAGADETTKEIAAKATKSKD